MTLMYRGIILKLILVGLAICISLLVPELTQFVSIVSLVCIIVLTLIDIFDEENVSRLGKLFTTIRLRFLPKNQPIAVQKIFTEEDKKVLDTQLAVCKSVDYKTKESVYLHSALSKIEITILSQPLSKRAKMYLIEKNLPSFVNWFESVLTEGIRVDQLLKDKDLHQLKINISKLKSNITKTKNIEEIADLRAIIFRKNTELDLLVTANRHGQDIEDFLYHFKNLLDQCNEFTNLVKKQRPENLVQSEYDLIRSQVDKLKLKLVMLGD